MRKQKAVSRSRWSTERVLSEICKLRDLSGKSVQQHHPKLYGAALRHFKSWKTAIEGAGFDYSKVVRRRLPGYWSRERVIEEIKKLPQRNSNFARQKRPDLYSAAIRVFESWEAAVECSGFHYSDVRKDWTPQNGSWFRLRKKE